MPTHRYTHFSYRSSRLSLTPTEVLEIEHIFAAVRYLTNHFTTLLEKLKLTKLLTLDLSVEAFTETAETLFRSPAFDHYRDVHSSFLEGALYDIAQGWQHYVTKRTNKPIFRKPQDEQVAWVLDATAVHIQTKSVYLPGNRNELTLPLAKITLYGRPTVYQLRRQKNNRYYLAALYERGVDNHPRTTDYTLVRLGVQLQHQLHHMESRYADDDTTYDALPPCLLRKAALLRYISPPTVPPDDTIERID